MQIAYVTSGTIAAPPNVDYLQARKTNVKCSHSIEFFVLTVFKLHMYKHHGPWGKQDSKKNHEIKKY